MFNQYTSRPETKDRSNANSLLLLLRVALCKLYFSAKNYLHTEEGRVDSNVHTPLVKTLAMCKMENVLNNIIFYHES